MTPVEAQRAKPKRLGWYVALDTAGVLEQAWVQSIFAPLLQHQPWPLRVRHWSNHQTRSHQNWRDNLSRFWSRVEKAMDTGIPILLLRLCSALQRLAR